MLYSFDIFDTILYRMVPKATDVFLIMEQDERIKHIWKSVVLFSDARRGIEFLLRRISKKEITIEDIYGKLGSIFNLSLDEQQEMIRLELEIELKNTFLHEKSVNKIKQLLDRNEKVILVSDMYWHEKEIRKILVSKDIMFSDLPIYVSSDFGGTKANKKLYDIISKKENVNYKEWVHEGDNLRSDYKNAKSLGIRAILAEKPTRYKYENNLNLSVESKRLYGLISRTREKSTGDAYDLGVSFAAPIIYQYVNWIIERSINMKIDKLYFVLRDGYILKKVADVIIINRNLKISTEYLWGSRVAWRLPEITIASLKELSVWEKSNWIFRNPSYAYVTFERLGFSKEKLREILGDSFVNQQYRTFSDFKSGLDEALCNKRFCECLEENIISAGENLNLYLTEVLDNNVSYAFVDTNSTGKSQKDLECFFRRKKIPIDKLRFFYHTFLTEHNLDEEKQFVFNKEINTEQRLPEALLRAPYNQCYGYRKEQKGMMPQLFEGRFCAWKYSFSYDEYLMGIIAFVEAIEKDEFVYDVDNYVRILNKIANFDLISDDINQLIAKLPFNPDMCGEEILDFYPQIRIASIFRPFSELIYYPKGSYYGKGGIWIVLYKILQKVVKIRRRKF